jgi:hypothetical protein
MCSNSFKTFKISTSYAHGVIMICMDLRARRTISLHSINIYCTLRTESLKIIHINLIFKTEGRVGIAWNPSEQ